MAPQSFLSDWKLWGPSKIIVNSVNFADHGPRDFVEHPVWVCLMFLRDWTQVMRQGQEHHRSVPLIGQCMISISPTLNMLSGRLIYCKAIPFPSLINKCVCVCVCCFIKCYVNSHSSSNLDTLILVSTAASWLKYCYYDSCQMVTP